MKGIIDEHNVFNGKLLSSEIIENVKVEISNILKCIECCNKTVKLPHVAIILIGDNPASHLYVKTKSSIAEDLGIEVSLYKFLDSVKEEDIIFLINNLNNDMDVNGIMIQLPIAKHFNTERILNSVLPSKDIDGTADNSDFIPATALAVMETINTVVKELNIDLKGKIATVIGASKSVGKPVHNLLISNGIQSTITDKDWNENSIKNMCIKSDIIVSATGHMELVKRDWVKDGAIVIDVGITKVGVSKTGKAILKGDVDINNLKDKVSAITPVVGGIGPITISMLMTNIIKAYKIQNRDKQ